MTFREARAWALVCDSCDEEWVGGAGQTFDRTVLDAVAAGWQAGPTQRCPEHKETSK